jgi:hypothetical protein
MYRNILLVHQTPFKNRYAYPKMQHIGALLTRKTVLSETTKFVVTWLTTLSAPSYWKSPMFNLEAESSYLDWDFECFSSVPPGKCWDSISN